MDPLIIFTHIQKTAGVSFMERLVYPNLGEKDVLYRIGYKDFFSIKPHHKFARGHISYGLHKFTLRPCRYITFLRHPIDRAISHYYFIRQCDPSISRHSRHEIVQNSTLSEYYQIQRYKNEITKMIAGIELERLHRHVDSSLVDNILLARAKYNLEHKYSCFGLQGQFEESIRLFKQLFGWENENRTELHKKTRKRPSVDEIDSRTRNILVDSHQLDLELYQHALRLFDERVASLKRDLTDSSQSLQH